MYGRARRKLTLANRVNILGLTPAARQIFWVLDRARTPLFAAEVAERVGCSVEEVNTALERLRAVLLVTMTDVGAREPIGLWHPHPYAGLDDQEIEVCSRIGRIRDSVTAAEVVTWPEFQTWSQVDQKSTVAASLATQRVKDFLEGLVEKGWLFRRGRDAKGAFRYSTTPPWWARWPTLALLLVLVAVAAVVML